VEFNVTEPKTSLPPADKTMVSPVKTGKNRFSLFLSILTLIFLCASAFYFWQQQNLQTIKIQHFLNSTQSDSNKLESYQQHLQQQVNSLNELSSKQQTLLNSLAQESYFHTQKLTDLGARSRNDWLLAEAEYLMRLANQRLTLEQDLNSAEAMLTNADKIIAEINDPGLTEIRQALASEILSLQQVNHLDYQGLFLKLDALIASLDKLQQSSFIRKDTPEQPPENTEVVTEQQNKFMAIWSNIWKDLKQAVLIRRLDKPIEPLLAPEQDYYLKQNLRLMLEQASLALIDKNTLIYQSSLNKAAAWIDLYFTQDDPQTAVLKRTVTEMSSLKIDQELPDISKSLRLTKMKIESFYKQHTINKLSTPDSEIESNKLIKEGLSKGSAL
jgi:uroporphyrin-3 C-methyltransferase